MASAETETRVIEAAATKIKTDAAEQAAADEKEGLETMNEEQRIQLEQVKGKV